MAFDKFEKEINIFVASNKENTEVYLIKSQRSLLDYITKLKKIIEKPVSHTKKILEYQFYENNGGLKNISFMRKLTIPIINYKHAYNQIVNEFLEKNIEVFNLNKIPKIKPNYYELNKQKHIDYVKSKYIENREHILIQKKEYYQRKKNKLLI